MLFFENTQQWQVFIKNEFKLIFFSPLLVLLPTNKKVRNKEALEKIGLEL